MYSLPMQGGGAFYPPQSAAMQQQQQGQQPAVETSQQQQNRRRPTAAIPIKSPQVSVSLDILLLFLLNCSNDNQHWRECRE